MNDNNKLDIQEQYVKWTPVTSIPNSMYCEGIHDDYEGFRILLKGKNANDPILRIHFDSTIAYRNIEEGKRPKTLERITEKSTLYIVKNSNWLKWISNESFGMYDNLDIIHFAIYSLNDWIDVLSVKHPIVTWI
jgi:hypothetical protein